MALSKRTTTLIANLASRGDAFARHLLSKATKRDVILLGSLSKRGDLEAQKHLKGSSASVPAKAFVNRMAAAGDSIAQGLNDFRGSDKLAQTITFAQPAAKTFGDAPMALSATGGASGNAVLFSVVSGPGTVSGRTLTITGAGSIVVRATQAGNDNYLAAEAVQRTITVAKAAQAITFDPPATASVATDSPLTLTATGGASGAPVVFAVASGPATLADNVLTLTGAGDVVVTANQGEGVNYLAAPEVSRTITVTE